MKAKEDQRSGRVEYGTNGNKLHSESSDLTVELVIYDTGGEANTNTKRGLFSSFGLAAASATRNGCQRAKRPRSPMAEY